jgi:hypothetical protein
MVTGNTDKTQKVTQIKTMEDGIERYIEGEK